MGKETNTGGPALGGFRQMAYITTDLARAIGVFRDTYGVPSFFEVEADIRVDYRGAPGDLKLRFAVVDLLGMQIELIEPRPGCIDLYTEGLPRDGSFAIVPHHIAITFTGDAARWRGWRAELATQGREVAMEGRVGEDAGFMYVDDRARLGHYVEYIWNRGRSRLAELTPSYPEPV